MARSGDARCRDDSGTPVRHGTGAIDLRRRHAGASSPCGGAAQTRAAQVSGESERGDVPGWVLVTLMTAGLVIALWAIAGPALQSVFESAIAQVTGSHP